MKNLSSLTTFFITFLFVVYSGVFVGLKVNGLVAGKKLVDAASLTPIASVSPQPTPQPSVTLAEAPQTKAPTQVSTQTASTSNPMAVSAPATSIPSFTQTPPPAVDTSTPPPVDTPPPPAPSPPSEPPPSNRCIITISGGQYDVTEFRNIHSGGDVFQCGTDMTAAFLSRHPASFLSKMSQYKI